MTTTPKRDELPDDPISAFERIWRNEAMGGDYQIVLKALGKHTPAPGPKVVSYRHMRTQYERRIGIACYLMQEILPTIRNGATKKRMENYIKFHKRDKK